PPPLTVGPAPAIRLRVVTGGPPAVLTPPPPTPSTTIALGQTLVPPTSQVTASASQDFLVLASIPSGVLFALGSGPAGAVGDLPTPGLSPKLAVLERVFAQAPEILLGEQLLKITILTQPPRTESGDASETPETGTGSAKATLEVVPGLYGTPRF